MQDNHDVVEEVKEENYPSSTWNIANYASLMDRLKQS